jgi:hypothetical protein
MQNQMELCTVQAGLLAHAAAKRSAARAAQVAIEAAAQAAEKADEAARAIQTLRTQSGGCRRSGYGRTNTRRVLKRRVRYVATLSDPIEDAPVSKWQAAAGV